MARTMVHCRRMACAIAWCPCALGHHPQHDSPVSGLAHAGLAVEGPAASHDPRCAVSAWSWCAGGSVGDEHDDVWGAIAEGVEECFNDTGRISQLCVGPVQRIEDMIPGELLNEEDVERLLKGEQLEPVTIANLVGERWSETFSEGDWSTSQPAALTPDAEDAWLEVDEDGPSTTEGVLEWARKHISLEPEWLCAGEYPLPIEYRGGQWHAFAGARDPDLRVAEPVMAMVDYQVEGTAEGPEGWVWWVDGDFGHASSLREAMAAAEAELTRRGVR